MNMIWQLRKTLLYSFRDTDDPMNIYGNSGKLRDILSATLTIQQTYTVEPVYYGHLGTSQKCPDYQGVLIFQVSLHDNVSFGTTARCLDYAGVHIFKGPD